MGTVTRYEDMPELLFCPFCGGTARLVFGESEGRRVCRWLKAECQDCGASTGHFRTVREVIASWNDRLELKVSEEEGERIFAFAPEMYHILILAMASLRDGDICAKNLADKIEKLLNCINGEEANDE